MEIEQRMTDHHVSPLQQRLQVCNTGIPATEYTNVPDLAVRKGGPPVLPSTNLPVCEKPVEPVDHHSGIPVLCPSVLPVAVGSVPQPAADNKKKHQRPSRRKKVDDRTQTAPLSEMVSFL